MSNDVSTPSVKPTAKAKSKSRARATAGTTAIGQPREPARAIIVYDFEGEAVKGNSGAPGR